MTDLIEGSCTSTFGLFLFAIIECNTHKQKGEKWWSSHGKIGKKKANASYNFTRQTIKLKHYSAKAHSRRRENGDSLFAHLPTLFRPKKVFEFLNWGALRANISYLLVFHHQCNHVFCLLFCKAKLQIFICKREQPIKSTTNSQIREQDEYLCALFPFLFLSFFSCSWCILRDANQPFRLSACTKRQGKTNCRSRHLREERETDILM